MRLPEDQYCDLCNHRGGYHHPHCPNGSVAEPEYVRCFTCTEEIPVVDGEHGACPYCGEPMCVGCVGQVACKACGVLSEK
jgi:hypothetical protein